MQASCRGKCFTEPIKRIKIRKYYKDVEEYKKNLPAIPKSCGECGYATVTHQVRCYCCGNQYRTRPQGNSRGPTIDVIIECKRVVRNAL